MTNGLLPEGWSLDGSAGGTVAIETPLRVVCVVSLDSFSALPNDDAARGHHYCQADGPYR